MGDQRERERGEIVVSPDELRLLRSRVGERESERNEPAKLAEGRKRSDIPNAAAR